MNAGRARVEQNQPTFRVGRSSFLNDLWRPSRILFMNADVALRIRDRIADALGLSIVPPQDRKDERLVLRIDHVAEADTHIEHLEHFVIRNVRVPLNQRENRVRLDQPVDLEPDLRLHPRQVEQPIAGNVDQRLDAGDFLQDFHGLGHIDVRRPQQLLAERDIQLVEPVVDAIRMMLEERAARQRKAVAVNAAAAHSDDDVPCGDKFAADHLVEIDLPDRHPHEVEAFHNVRQLSGLPTRNRNTGHLGARAQSDGDGVEHAGVGFFDGDIIQQRKRFCADADHVIDVHRDAIDADRIVFAHRGRDHGLGTNAIGAERDPGTVDRYDIGKIADRQNDAAGPAFRPSGLDAPDDVAETSIGLGGVDAGYFVDFVPHVGGSALIDIRHRCGNRQSVGVFFGHGFRSHPVVPARGEARSKTPTRGLRTFPFPS